MEKNSQTFQPDLKLLSSVLHCAVPTQLLIMKPEQKPETLSCQMNIWT